MITFHLEKYIIECDTTIDRYCWLYSMLKKDKKLQREIKAVILILVNHKLLLQASKTGEIIKLPSNYHINKEMI